MNEMVARIFIDAQEDVRRVLTDTERLECGLSAIEFEVRRNSVAISDSISSDDWLLYTTVIEVFDKPRRDSEAKEVLAELSLLLGFIELLGVWYVTASDYEEQLPGNGRRLPD